MKFELGTYIVGRYPQPKNREPGSNTENGVTKVKKPSEIDEGAATLSETSFGTGITLRDT